MDSGEPFVYTRPKSGLASGIRRLATVIAGDAGTPEDERRGLMGILTR
jgi:hypothetical protein